jgi:hypothetical protein
MERAKPKQAGSLVARDCSHGQDVETTEQKVTATIEQPASKRD